MAKQAQGGGSAEVGGPDTAKPPEAAKAPAKGDLRALEASVGAIPPDAQHPVSNPAKYRLTLEALAKQEKVKVSIPKEGKESTDFPVTINGVRFIFMTGGRYNVPVQVSDMIDDRLASEGKLEKKSAEMVKNLEQSGLLDGGGAGAGN